MSNQFDAITVSNEFANSLAEVNKSSLTQVLVANNTYLKPNCINVVKAWDSKYIRHFAIYIKDITECDGEMSYKVIFGNDGQNIESDVDTKEDTFVPSVENCSKYLESWQKEYIRIKDKHHSHRRESDWSFCMHEQIMLSTNCEVMLHLPLE